MKKFSIEALDWQKMDNLMPAIIQDAKTSQVLMLGYMNQQALQQTLETKLVTFYSRSKQRLWTKGETSNNTLTLVEVGMDCDNDALLILVQPNGPTCHLGTTSCFKAAVPTTNFLFELENTIDQRIKINSKQSYVASLVAQGENRVAQKVGEEAVETVIAALAEKEKLTNEAADLLFHLLILLRMNDLQLRDIVQVLQTRKR